MDRISHFAGDKTSVSAVPVMAENGIACSGCESGHCTRHHHGQNIIGLWGYWTLGI